MILVFDSTPLIYLAKVEILSKLTDLNIELVIPRKVYEEVVEEGRRKGKQDAFAVEKLVSAGKFKVAEAKDKKFLNHISANPALSPADAETLALAKELKGTALLDESISRSVAEVEGIALHGSVFLLFLMQKRRIISKAELRNLFDSMISAGWRCSTELYAAILAEIEKLK